MDLLRAVEQLRSRYYLDEGSRGKIAASLTTDHDTRRNVWLHRLASDDYDHILNPSFGAPLAIDIEWLWSIRERLPYAAQLVSDVWIGSPPDVQTAVVEGASGDLQQHLQELSRRVAEQRAATLLRSEQEAAAAQELLNQNIDELSKRRAEIEAGRDVDAMIQAYQHSSTHMTRSDLDFARLRPLVGDEYIEVLRRGFIACWRLHDVELPTPGDNSSLLRYAVGLAGIGMAVRGGFDLSTLNATEAALATRYALYEINGLPFWFEELLDAHHDVVVGVLREAIKLGWDYAGVDHHSPLRVASRSTPPVAHVLRAIAVDQLRERAPAHHDTTRWAVDSLLTSSEQRAEIRALVDRELKRADMQENERVEWVRLLAHFAPHEAAAWLRESLASGDASAAFALHLAERLEHDLDDRVGVVRSSDLMSPSALGEWIGLMLTVVRFEDDVRIEGGHIVGRREFAEHFRDRCLKYLANTTTPEAHSVMRRLIADTGSQSDRRIFERMAETQRAIAANVYRTWTEDDVLRIERGDEKVPRTLDELFSVTLNHLQHVARLVENDDFSYRHLFKDTTPEREVQLWAASCLRERAGELYSVVRENVVDDNKEVDISTFARGVGYVPIEIKPVDRYTYRLLVETIEKQLLGRYMQPPDRRYGVLLLARLGTRSWTVDDRSVDLAGVVDALRKQAKAIGAEHGKVIHVEVIDMLHKPGQLSTQTAATDDGGTSESRTQAFEECRGDEPNAQATARACAEAE